MPLVPRGSPAPGRTRRSVMPSA